jgi:hypothetical protein
MPSEIGMRKRPAPPVGAGRIQNEIRKRGKSFKTAVWDGPWAAWRNLKCTKSGEIAGIIALSFEDGKLGFGIFPGRNPFWSSQDRQ